MKQLKLEENEEIILWLIMDKIEIKTSKDEHNSLILGDVYDIGLNMMNIVNKKVEHWKLVNDLLSMERIQSENTDEDALIYDCPLLAQRKKVQHFHVFLTQKGLEALKYYIDEFGFVIDFLRKQLKINDLKDKKNKSLIRNRFYADELIT